MQSQLQIRGDTFLAIVSGPLVGPLADEMLQQLEQILDKHPYYFVIANVSAMTGIPSETRARAGRWPYTDRCGGNAIVGAGLVVRTLVTMVARAVALVGKRVVPVAFFATEQEAWIWIARRRQELGLPPASSSE
jgi:hypothetical protein